MGLVQTEAIVLKSFPLGDHDKIVVLFTRSLGKISGVAQGARRIKSQFSGNLEILNWIEILFFLKEGRDLVSIDKVNLISSYSSNLPTYRCFLQLTWLAELVFETTPEREPNDSLFRLMLLVLPRISKSSISDLAQLYFEIWHLKLSGLFPSCRSCHVCGGVIGNDCLVFLSADFTRFCCTNCKRDSDIRLSFDTFRWLRSVLANSLEDLEGSLPRRDEISALSNIVESMIEKSFERRFSCLRLIQSER